MGIFQPPEARAEALGGSHPTLPRPLGPASLPTMAKGEKMPSHETEDDPWVGRELAEQVEVRTLIGVGAMGRVYRGHQRGIERPVAVKVLHADLLHRPGVMERFHREARVASRLNHPNVVQVLMTGEVAWHDPSSQGGPTTKQGVGRRAVSLSAERGGDGESPSTQRVAYLVMEYLDGDSLASVLENHGGPLRLERALHIALQVCDAVGEAHDQGIVHRDLKPENVMLVRRGGDPDFVKVLDFGVAKVDWLDGAQATQVGTVFGTARYMAPEAARGELVTPRSDVYSIATLLYQCLAGRTPFDGTNTVAVLVKQCSEVPLELSTISPHVPAAVARVVHQTLSKNPAERCATARELGAALMAAAREARVEGFATAARPTLHGAEGPPPTDPFSRRGDCRPRTALRSPSETTLIDPDLAGTPAGDAPRRTRHEARTSCQEATCVDAPRRGTTLLEEAGAFDERRRTALTAVPDESPSERSLEEAEAIQRQARRTLLEQAVDAAPATHHGPSPYTTGPTPAPPAPHGPSQYTTAPAPAASHGPSQYATGPIPSPSVFHTFGDTPGLPGHASSLWAADAPPPSAPRRPRRPRVLRWMATFTVLAGVAAGGAYFAAQLLSAEDQSLAAYVDRANGALALGSWTSDDGTGFVEITSAGLSRYPDAAALRELQTRGARRMAREARRLQDSDADRALELARLSVELAPEDDAVRRLTAPLLDPPAPALASVEAPEQNPSLADPGPITEPETPGAMAAQIPDPLPQPAGAESVQATATQPAGSATTNPAQPAGGSAQAEAGSVQPAARPTQPTAAPTPPSPTPRPATKPKATAPKASTSKSNGSRPASPPPTSEGQRNDDGSDLPPETPRERWL